MTAGGSARGERVGANARSVRAGRARGASVSPTAYRPTATGAASAATLPAAAWPRMPPHPHQARHQHGPRHHEAEPGRVPGRRRLVHERRRHDGEHLPRPAAPGDRRDDGRPPQHVPGLHHRREGDERHQREAEPEDRIQGPRHARHASTRITTAATASPAVCTAPFTGAGSSPTSSPRPSPRSLVTDSAVWIDPATLWVRSHPNPVPASTVAPAATAPATAPGRTRPLTRPRAPPSRRATITPMNSSATAAA